MSPNEPDWSALLAAVRRAPSEMAGWDALEDAAAVAQRPDEAADAFRAALRGEYGALNAEALDRLGQRALGFHEEWFGDSSPLVGEVIESVLRRDAGSAWALQRISVLYTMQERWAPLLAHFDRAIAAVRGDDYRVTALLEEAAQLAKDFANDPARAIGYYRTWRAERPDDEQVYLALERLLEKERRHGDLVELWRERLASSESQSERRALHVRIADTYLGPLADPAAALGEARELAALDPSAGRRVLEAVLGHPHAAVEARREALDRLRRSFDENGQSVEVERALLTALPFETREGAVALRRELVDRLAARGAHVEAFDQQAAQVVVDPLDAFAFARLAELAPSVGAERHAAAVLAAAEGAPGGRAIALRFVAAGILAAGGLGPQAEALHRQLLDGPDVPVEARRDAARVLVRTVEEHRGDERLALLERLASLETDPAESRRVIGLAARLAAARGEFARAHAAWAERVARDPRDLEALDARIELLRDGDDADAATLASLLRSRLEQTTTAALRRSITLELAQVLEVRVGDADAALEVYEGFAAEHGEHEVVDALDRLYAGAANDGERLALLDRAASADASRAVDVLVRLASARRATGGDPLSIARDLMSALRLDPGHAGARASLEGLLDEPSTRGVAADALAEAALFAGDHAQVVRLLPVRLEGAAAARQRLRLYMEAAELQAGPLEDASAAFDAIQAALDVAPTDENLERQLIRLARASGRTRDAGLRLAEVAARVDESRRAAELARAGAELLAGAGDGAAALGALVRALEHDPRDRETALRVFDLADESGDAAAAEAAATTWVTHSFATRAIDEALTARLVAVGDRGQWDAVCASLELGIAATFDAALEASGAPHLRSIGLAELARDMERNLAVFHRDRRGDEAASMKALSRALGHDAAHAELLRELARLQWRAPGRPLVDTLVALSDRVVGDLDALYDAAHLALDPVGDASLARDTFERLFQEATRLWRRGERARGERPPEATALEAQANLVRLELAAARFERAIDWLIEGSRLPIEAPARLAMLRQAADIARDRLGDEERALRLYEQVVAASMADTEAVDRVTEIYEKRQRIPELLALRQRELAGELTPERRLGVRLEIARLVGALEDGGTRLEALRANLTQVPGHEASIAELTRVLEARGRERELVDVLAAQARRVEEDRSPTGATRSASLWSEVARVAEHLGDHEKAYVASRRVAQLAPTAATFDRLSRLAVARGEPASAAEWLEKGLELAPPDARPELFVRLAEARLAAGKHDRATLALERALIEAPSSHAHELLVTLYRQQRRFDALARLLAQGVLAGAAPDRLLADAKEAALLFRDQVGDLTLALPVLEKAQAAGVLDLELKLCLAAAYRAAGRLADARAVLDAVVLDFGRRRSPERALAHLELARVAQASGDATEALDQLDKAASMDMAHAGILQMQGELARDAGQLERSERAFRSLLLIVRRRKSDELVDVGSSEVLYELSRLALDRGQTSQAEELLASAREAARQSMREAARFTRALIARRDVALADEILALRLRGESDPEAKARVLSDQATLLDRARDDGAAALDARLAAIDAAPEWDSEVDRAAELAARRGLIAAFADGLERVAGKLRRREDALIASTLLLRAATTLEHAGELDRATEILGQVEQVGARAVDAWRGLGRIARLRGDRVGEIRALRRLVSAGADAAGLEGEASLDEGDRTDALYRIAEVELRSAESATSGLETLRDALARDGNHARVARVISEAARVLPPTEALEDLWAQSSRQAGDPAAAAAFLRHRVEAGTGTVRDVHEAVTLFTQLEDDAAVGSLLARGVELARRDVDGLAGALWILEALAERALAGGDPAGAFAWWLEGAEAAESAGDPDAVVWRRRAADIGLERGLDRSRVAGLVRDLLAREPGDRALWQAMVRSHSSSSDRGAFDAAMRSALDALVDPDERNELRIVMADHLLADPTGEAEATAVLQEIIDEDPDHLRASERLLDLYQRRGESAALAELLGRQLDRARDRGDVPAILSLSLRRGALLAAEDRVAAVEVYRSALDWAPDDTELLRALVRTMSSDDDAVDRAHMGERLLARVEGAEAAQLAVATADLYAAFDDEEGVGRVLWLGVRAHAADDTLRTRLDRWLEARGDELGKAEVAVLDALARKDARQRTQRLATAAATFRQLGRPDRAAETLGAALQHAPGDAALLTEYVTSMLAWGRPDRAMEVIDPIADGAKGLQRAATLGQRARLHLAGGATADAVRDLEEAASTVPREYKAQLVDALEQHMMSLASAGDRAAERETVLRFATMVASTDLERARLALANWVARSPDDAEALRSLRDLDLGAGRFADSIGAAHRLVEVETGDAQIEAALVLYDAASKVGAPALARPGLERTFADQPSEPRVRGLLRAIYEASEAYRELAALLRVDAASQTGEPRLETLRRVAELYVQRVGDYASAVPPAQEALAMRPEDGDTIVVLADAYIGAGALAEAVELLNDAINQKNRKRSPALAGMQLRMGRIAGMSGDAATQVEWLKVALDTDKGNAVIAAELAELALALGDDATASNALRVVSLAKTPGPMSKAVASLRQAEIAQRQGDRQKAILLARRARMEDPELHEATRFLSSIGEG